MDLKEEQNLKLPESDYNSYLQSRSAWRRWLDKFLYRFGYIHVRQLDYARDINKRLDEQRETILEIGTYSDIFNERPWVLQHMQTQDEFLTILYFLRHGVHPDGPDKNPFDNVREKVPNKQVTGYNKRESLAHLQEQVIKPKEDIHNTDFNLLAELVEYVIKIAKHHKIHIINLANKSEIEDMHKMLDSAKYINVASVIERHAITPEQLEKTREEIQQFIAKQGEAS